MKKNRWILCLVTLLVVVLCVAMIAACDEDPEGSGSADKCIVTFAGVKTTTVEVEKGQKVAKPEAEQKKSGYTFVGWYLGRSLYDFDTPVTEDIVLEAKFERDEFDVAHGSVFGLDGGYMSGSTDSLMVFNDKTFSGGTFIASVTPGTSNDCGVIFGLADDRESNFWEDEHYFCAIINRDGYFILAEIVPSSSSPWNEITNSDAFEADYDPSETYTFKVGYTATDDPAKGYCEIRVNDVVVAENKINALDGNGIGYRSQGDGVRFSNITIDVNDIPEVVDRSVVGDLRVKHGSMSLDEYNDYVSDSADTIAVYKDSISGSKYSVSVTLTKGAANEDDGIVFGLSDNGQSDFWENNGVSYYFFFISKDNTAYLGKVNANEDDVWEMLDVSHVLATATTYDIKVEVDGNLIKCYVDGDLMIEYTAEDMLTGNLVGIRAGGKGAIYSELVVTETPAQAE